MLRPFWRRLRRTLGRHRARLARRAPWLCPARGRRRVHVRAFRRGPNAATVVTTVQGLPARPEPAAVLKALKKALGCGGSLVQDPRHGQVLYLHGDQRARARAYLVDEDRASAGAAAAAAGPPTTIAAAAAAAPGSGGGYAYGRPLDPRAVVVHKGCEQQLVCPQCGYWEPRKAQRWKLWTKCKSCGHRQWFRR